MHKRELKISVVLQAIEESKQQIAVLSSSVDPVSSTRTSLIKVEAFIMEMEKEVVDSLPVENRVPKMKQYLVFTSLLMPAAKLLLELLAEARQVIEQLLR